MKSQKGSAHIVIIVVLIVLLLGLLGFNFWQNFVQKKDTAAKTETQTTATTKASDKETSQQVAPSVPTQPPVIVDITDLGLSVTMPASLSDLTYQVTRLEGDQAVNSVALSSKKAEAAGCNKADAPLGYLTYDSDKGGALVGTARGSNVYYLETKMACSAVTSSDIAHLKTALKTVVAN